MRVKIRRCQVIKLILTGFVVVKENIKPSVLMHRARDLGLYFKDLGLYIFLYNTKPVSIRILLLRYKDPFLSLQQLLSASVRYTMDSSDMAVTKCV